MREDPIIAEDWKIGSTTFFQFRKLPYIDFFFSSILVVLGLYVSFDLGAFVYLFIWSFTFFVLLIYEILLDQKTRSIYARISVLGILLLIYSLSVPFTEEYQFYLIAGGVIVMLKIGLAPLLVFLLEFYENILIPNSENVQLVLNEHVARMSETDYGLETPQDFRDRVSSYLNSILIIIGISIIASFTLYLLLKYSGSAGLFISLAVLTICSLSFTYTVVTWYISQKLQNRKKAKSIELGESPVFPEMLS